jgi:hypothetical protein
VSQSKQMRSFGFLVPIALAFWMHPDTSFSQEEETSAPATPALVDDYDRLDGVGKSGKTVQVIEWEGNLEVHVYPGGSLKGLGLKFDTQTKNKKVMVLAYRFENTPLKTYVRRAMLSIPLPPKFNVYLDPTTRAEYDKIIISGNTLSGGLIPYKLDPEPKQLYPEGHPNNQLAQPAPPASESQKPSAAPPFVIAPQHRTPSSDETQFIEDGAIKPFSW